MIGVINLGRAGVADKWQDIALCVRCLRHNLGSKSEPCVKLLFELPGLEPDWEKIHYYNILGELL